MNNYEAAFSLESFAYLVSELMKPERKLSNGLCVFHMMVKAGLTEELQICLQNGIDVDYLTDMDAPEGMKMQSALHIATSEKHLETMKMLMDMGANLNV